MLRALAESPSRMDALLNLGFDVFNALYSRAGQSIQELDNYLEALTRIHGRLPRETQAIEFRELLDNLQRNDSRAWERLEAEVGNTSHPSTISPLTRALTPEEIDEEIRRLGVNPETQGETYDLLRREEALRRSLIENPLAARALRRCNSACFPENATPDQIARINRFLSDVSEPGEIDYELLTRYFHVRRDQLQRAIDDLDQPGRTAADVNAIADFYASGRTPTIVTASQTPPRSQRIGGSSSTTRRRRRDREVTRSQLSPEEQRAADLLEIFEERQARGHSQQRFPENFGYSRSDLEQDLSEVFDIPDLSRARRTPGGRAIPEQFEVGNFSHRYAEDLIPESELPRGLVSEYRIIDIEPSTGRRIELGRVDRLDPVRGVVYEVKPRTTEWIERGERQARLYAAYLDDLAPLPDGRRWSHQVVTYDGKAVKQVLRSNGYLR
ncbi:hypothetical protein IQ273_18560 [Nodosilinea sp. LEGE 07298]|uniref:hypothetical protein n=1 Tax=Nodosilinea sp. LEGE 07298 TaxID=2777970 RepID=UPI00187FB101|nr:hypothetical protein [Nodosilinea sp. LEGE 07298]MBE9111410.1 hypothetical protein [Nodosilinea sp. LEGE 07298]